MTNPLGEPERGVSVKARAMITNVNNEEDHFKFSGNDDTMTATSARDGIAYFICNIPTDGQKAEFSVSEPVEHFKMKF